MLNTNYLPNEMKYALHKYIAEEIITRKYNEGAVHEKEKVQAATVEDI